MNVCDCLLLSLLYSALCGLGVKITINVCCGEMFHTGVLPRQLICHKKYLTLIYFVVFTLEYFPFFTSIIVLLLSWYTILYFTSYPCVSINKRVHNIMGIRSSIPTSLYSVELRVLSFCFEDVDYGFPFLILMAPPVCT